MKKANELAFAFLKKRSSTEIAPKAALPINAFNAIFSVQDLSDGENRAIEKIFVDGYMPGVAREEQIHEDITEIKNISKELKAIKKQEAILIGERISKAKAIFDRYKERSFRSWMEFVFGSFKTGYNYLAYYDLYSNFPEELKDPLKEMPSRAAYVLASKQAPIEQKIAIVKNHFGKKSDDLLSVIRRELGSSPLARRYSSLDLLEQMVLKFVRKRRTFSEEDRSRIRKLISSLNDLI